MELHDLELHKSVSSQTSDDPESESLTKEGCYSQKDIHKNGSHSGRCTSHETTVSECGSVSVRFEEMLIDVINATTIHVDWCPVINNNNLHGYKIRYATKDNSSYNEIFVTSGISSFTITGLRPNTEYDIWVNAIDGKENVIHPCGWAMQRTDNLTDDRKTFEVPYIAAIAAIALLLIAVIVPITFLFMRNCGECETSPSDENGKAEIVQEKVADIENMETKIMTSSFRHRNDVIRKFVSTGLSFQGRRNRP